MKKQILCMLGLAFLLALMALQLASAVDFSQNITASDKATFDQILTPVMTIYNLVKYIASAIAGVVLLFAGVTYMTSGSDPKKRENAKDMAMYVVIGLIVIWAAPMIVKLVVG